MTTSASRVHDYPADARAVNRLPPPIFVGGTGRSGTTILGRLIGRHPDHEVIPVEARFHCTADGLPGVLDGTVTPEEFSRRMVEKWYIPEKLAAFINLEDLQAALARFLEGASSEPRAAARALVLELFDRYARSRGKRGWVEMTPVNSLSGAPALAEMFPELRMVNVMRDGRDVASSLIAVGWMSDIREALAWWESRMLQSHETCERIPPQALYTVRFERLVVEDRAGALKELCEFFGWDDEPTMQRFFERRMAPENAHVGRWKTHFSANERVFLEAEYQAALARLTGAGVAVP